MEQPSVEEIRKVALYFMFLQEAAKLKLWNIGGGDLAEEYERINNTVVSLLRFDVLHKALGVEQMSVKTYRSLFAKGVIRDE